jgi:predicted CXXCH cytochrome family protein
LTDTSIGNASDFGELHPQFRPAFYTKFGQEKPVRMSLADNLKEENGLKFPHDLHLNRTGGVARMATKLGKQAGYGAPLECSNCHTEDANGIGFKPVEMETACENCHSLVFDRVGGIFRKLPHGDVDQARANLLAMDRTPRKPLVTGRRRPGMFAKGEAYFSNFGPPRPELAGTNQPLGPGGVCRECHLPANIGGRPDVVPIKIPDRYLFHGYFDHAAHDQEKCSSCHKAGTSSSSSDLLLPGIAVCRDCHLGEDATRAEVPSNCAMCHSYHTPSGPAPLDHPRDRRDFTAMINPLRLRNGE